MRKFTLHDHDKDKDKEEEDDDHHDYDKTYHRREELQSLGLYQGFVDGAIQWRYRCAVRFRFQKQTKININSYYCFCKGTRQQHDVRVSTED